MSIWKFAIAILLFFCACGSAKYPLQPKKIILVDSSSLSSTQQRVVHEAELSWMRQTHGCVQIIEDKSAEVKIIRMTPPEKYDSENSWVLGMCLPTIGDCKTIELAFTKMLGYEQAIIVVAHELGHEIGLDHNEGAHSLMSRNIYGAWLGLSLEDRIDLFKATGCQ